MAVRGRFALARIPLVARCEVLIRVAILHEFARHSRDKAEDYFLYCSKVLERDTIPVYILERIRRLVVSYNIGTLFRL